MSSGFLQWKMIYYSKFKCCQAHCWMQKLLDISTSTEFWNNNYKSFNCINNDQMTTFLVTWLQHRELGLGRTLFPAGRRKTCQLLHKTFCMFRCWDVDWWPVKGTTSSWPLLRNLDLALNSAKYPDLPLRCSMYMTDDRSHSKSMILGSYDMTVLRWLAIDSSSDIIFWVTLSCAFVLYL